MDELIKVAERKSKQEADKVLQDMKQNNRVGKIEVDEERITYACKIYLGLKDLFDRYNITVASLCGKSNAYRMLITKGKAEPIIEKEWLDAGKRLLVKLSFNCDIKEAFERMLSGGIDHHLLLKEGDLTSQLVDLCDLLGVSKAYL